MRARTAAAVVVVVVALAGCGGSDDSQDEPAAAVMCPAANEVIGMTVEEATALAQEHGCSVRVTERDGDPLPATMDLRNDRIDVTVVDDHITAVAAS
jgi:hypothetical protein